MFRKPAIVVAAAIAATILTTSVAAAYGYRGAVTIRTGAKIYPLNTSTRINQTASVQPQARMVRPTLVHRPRPVYVADPCYRGRRVSVPHPYQPQRSHV